MQKLPINFEILNKNKYIQRWKFCFDIARMNYIIKYEYFLKCNIFLQCQSQWRCKNILHLFLQCILQYFKYFTILLQLLRAVSWLVSWIRILYWTNFWNTNEGNDWENGREGHWKSAQLPQRGIQTKGHTNRLYFFI